MLMMGVVGVMIKKMKLLNWVRFYAKLDGMKFPNYGMFYGVMFRWLGPGRNFRKRSKIIVKLFLFMGCVIWSSLVCLAGLKFIRKIIRITVSISMRRAINYP